MKRYVGVCSRLEHGGSAVPELGKAGLSQTFPVPSHPNRIGSETVLVSAGVLGFQRNRGSSLTPNSRSKSGPAKNQIPQVFQKAMRTAMAGKRNTKNTHEDDDEEETASLENKTHPAAIDERESCDQRFNSERPSNRVRRI